MPEQERRAAGTTAPGTRRRPSSAQVSQVKLHTTNPKGFGIVPAHSSGPVDHMRGSAVRTPAAAP